MTISIQGLRPGSSGTIDSLATRAYQRTYRLHSTDLVAEDEYAILVYMYGQGYRLYAPHPTDPRARIVGLTATVAARFTDGAPGLLWDVQVNWGPFNPLEYAGPDEDPINMPVKFRLDPVVVEVPVFFDRHGDGIINSATDPFDPGITDEKADYILTVLRNEVDIDLVALMILSGRGQINAEAWNGFPEETVKILPIKIPDRLWSQVSSRLYFPMEYTLHINFDTWKRKVIDQGCGELKTSGGTTYRTAILDRVGAPTTTPVLLDGSGHRLAQPITPPDAVFLEFDLNEPIDFGFLALEGLFT